MTAASFTQKQIDVTITLGTGSFGDTGFNTVKLTGRRATCSIEKGGYPSMDRAQVRVYGVAPSVMNAVSTLGVPLTMYRHNNTMLIEAGDTTNGMAVVYTGYITAAWQDYSEAPETALNLIGWGGQGEANFPVPPLSFSGPVDAATILAGLAQRMGWQFENSGVTTILPPSYCPGTALEQAHNIARAADVQMAVDTSTSPITLAIWPKTRTRGGAVPLISASSGLVGYPQFQSNGMSFRTLFNPGIRLGAAIQMQSSIGQAPQNAKATDPVPAGTQTGGPNGLWYVVGPLAHELSAQVPGGPWFTNVACARLNVPGAP